MLLQLLTYYKYTCNIYLATTKEITVKEIYEYKKEMIKKLFLIEQEENNEPKCFGQISLSDLMGNPYMIMLFKHKNGLFDMCLIDDDFGDKFKESDINPLAIEGFADFCKKFLKCYENIDNFNLINKE